MRSRDRAWMGKEGRLRVRSGGNQRWPRPVSCPATLVAQRPRPGFARDSEGKTLGASAAVRGRRRGTAPELARDEMMK